MFASLLSRVIPSAKAIRRRERTPRLSAEIFLGGGGEGGGGRERTVVDVKLQGGSQTLPAEKRIRVFPRVNPHAERVSRNVIPKSILFFPSSRYILAVL